MRLDLVVLPTEALKHGLLLSQVRRGRVASALRMRCVAAGMLAKSVNDAGWASFIAKLTYKAAEADRELVKAPANGASQRCVWSAESEDIEPNKAPSIKIHSRNNCPISLSTRPH